MDVILVSRLVDISELKASPTAVFDNAEGMPVAVLNGNKPVAYIIPAAAWEHICELLEDAELRKVAQQRLNDGRMAVEAGLDDLAP